MNSSTVAILIAFACYLLLMIVIGAVYSNETGRASDFVAGGGGITGNIEAVYAQGSEMCG